MENLDYLIGYKFEDAERELKKAGITVNKIIVSSDKVKRADTLVVLKTALIDGKAYLYLGEFLYNI